MMIEDNNEVYLSFAAGVWANALLSPAFAMNKMKKKKK